MEIHDNYVLLQIYFNRKERKVLRKERKTYNLNKLVLIFNRTPKAIVPMPKGEKITAPVAHFESIEFAHNITAKNILIIPIKPTVNIIISIGNLGKSLVLMCFKYSPINVGIKVIKKG